MYQARYIKNVERCAGGGGIALKKVAGGLSLLNEDCALVLSPLCFSLEIAEASCCLKILVGIYQMRQPFRI